MVFFVFVKSLNNGLILIYNFILNIIVIFWLTVENNLGPWLVIIFMYCILIHLYSVFTFYNFTNIHVIL